MFTMSADFGIHVHTVSPDCCGILTIDNLSEIMVNVSLEILSKDNLIAHLASSLVQTGKQIKISFYIEDDHQKFPSLAFLSLNLIVHSTSDPNNQSKCHILAYVRRSLPCAIITSSSQFLFKSSHCTLASQGYTEFVKLQHTFPKCILTPQLTSIFIVI
jgi:hypothetical protein